MLASSSWADIAEQAKQVVGDAEEDDGPTKFNTAHSFSGHQYHPRLPVPCAQLWRSPVWADQVYFSVTRPAGYGFSREADILTEVRNNAQDSPPTTSHENYNP